MQLPTHGQKWSNMATQRLLMAQCLALRGRTICTANAQTHAKFSDPRLLQADDMPLVAPELVHRNSDHMQGVTVNGEKAEVMCMYNPEEEA